MPPQKNAGNRGAKKDSGVSFKNQKFIRDLFSDLKEEGTVDDVFIGRVIKRLGNGRMDVYYVDKDHPKQTQAVIRGSFRGRGKRSVWIDVGSFVAIASTGVDGSLAFEIAAVLTSDQVRDLYRQGMVDGRIVNYDSTAVTQEAGFEIDNEKQEEEELDINAI
jgi:translation initiation factor IF-1